jgi:hypothetical protein
MTKARAQTIGISIESSKRGPNRPREKGIKTFFMPPLN